MLFSRGAGGEVGLAQAGGGFLHHMCGDQLLQGQGARVTALPESSSQQVRAFALVILFRQGFSWGLLGVLLLGGTRKGGKEVPTP